MTINELISIALLLGILLVALLSFINLRTIQLSINIIESQLNATESHLNVIQCQMKIDNLLMERILKNINPDDFYFHRDKYLSSINSEHLNELFSIIEPNKIKSFTVLEEPLMQFRIILKEIFNSNGILFDQFKKNDFLVIEKLKKDIIKELEKVISNQIYISSDIDNKLK